MPLRGWLSPASWSANPSTVRKCFWRRQQPTRPGAAQFVLIRSTLCQLEDGGGAMAAIMGPRWLVRETRPLVAHDDK